MWRGKKRAIKEKNHNTKGGGSGCSFPEEWNLPKPQLSFITAHRHVAFLATEPNKPLDRISFLISQTLSGSTAPRLRSANTGSLYLQPLATCYTADQGYLCTFIHLPVTLDLY